MNNNFLFILLLRFFCGGGGGDWKKILHDLIFKELLYFVKRLPRQSGIVSVTAASGQPYCLSATNQQKLCGQAKIPHDTLV